MAGCGLGSFFKQMGSDCKNVSLGAKLKKENPELAEKYKQLTPEQQRDYRKGYRSSVEPSGTPINKELADVRNYTPKSLNKDGFSSKTKTPDDATSTYSGNTLANSPTKSWRDKLPKWAGGNKESSTAKFNRKREADMTARLKSPPTTTVSSDRSAWVTAAQHTTLHQRTAADRELEASIGSNRGIIDRWGANGGGGQTGANRGDGRWDDHY